MYEYDFKLIQTHRKMFASHAHSTKQCFQKKKKNSKQCTEVLNQTATTNTSNFGTGPTFPIKMYFPLNVHIRIFFFFERKCSHSH